MIVPPGSGRSGGRRRPTREAWTVTATTPALVPVPAAPEGHTYSRITVEPIAGACGAIVGGADLAHDLDDDVIAEIRRAVLDHQVVLFRGQDLTPEQQVAFSRRFGPFSPVPFIEPIADHPEVIAVVREAIGGAAHSRSAACGTPTSRSSPSRRSRRSCTRARCRRSAATRCGRTRRSHSRRCRRACRRCSPGLNGVHSATKAYSPAMQQLHDRFTGMTVHTSDEADRTQLHPVVRVHPRPVDRRCS